MAPIWFVLRRKNSKTRCFSVSKLSESDADFMIGQSNQEIQASNRTNAVDEGTSSNYTTDPVQFNSPQLDMPTLEENIVSEVRSEVDNVMTTVDTGVQDAVLTAIEMLIPSVEMAMKSANASS